MKQRTRHYCFECSKSLRKSEVIRFQGKDICAHCLVVAWEPVYLEHYVRDGTTALGRAIEAGPTEAMVHDIRVSDYHSATQMYYRSPRTQGIPGWAAGRASRARTR